MDGSLKFLRIPTPDRTELIVAAVVFLLLFLVAIIGEIVRRRYLRVQRVRRAWEEVYRITRSKELSDTELRLLQTVVSAQCPLDPLGFVTVRRVFNAAVERYLASVSHDPARFEQEGALLRDLRVRLGLDFVPIGQPIDTTRDLSRGQVILAKPAADTRGSWFKLTVTQLDEAYITAAADFSGAEQEAPLLKPGDEITCRLWREDDARYAFKSTIVRLEHVRAVPPSAIAISEGAALPDVIVFCHGTDFQRTQSRAFYRVRHNQPTSVGIVPGPLDGNYEGAALRKPTTHIRARIVSLSAGGMAMETQQPLPQHVLLRATLDMPDTEPVTVTAQIVGVSSVGAGRYLVRGAFVDISESERDVIAQYVWRKQQPPPKSENVLI